MIDVELLDWMGDDVAVVNAARVSFAKESEYHWDEDDCEFYLKEGDKGLLDFLARKNHWSPFAHVTLKFRIKAPIFVARQLVKHQVGLVWNEVSRRYVDTTPTFYVPDGWRKKAESVKQGSSDETVDISDIISINGFYQTMASVYEQLKERGVCPEQIRMLMPQSMMTEWIWTGSLLAFSRVCKLRQAKDTQAETRIVADRISYETEQVFPESWAALQRH
ncbi:FAD-dependent thymidylate synthase [Xanthobacter wiegelii]|uniref:FAD-dependent thymidylate synthase n=1 Tax=Xanthobacter wiegelii TaxID=3119913 RepID=UPI0037281153